MALPSSTLSDERKQLVGEKVWLEYFDQNERFGEAFTPQYGTIVRQFECGERRDDWYLVKLERELIYEGATYNHIVISSRWAGERVGGAQPTAIFVVLAPEPERLNEPFQVDPKLYIAWGMAARSKKEIDKFLRRNN